MRCRGRWTPREGHRRRTARTLLLARMPWVAPAERTATVAGGRRCPRKRSRARCRRRTARERGRGPGRPGRAPGRRADSTSPRPDGGPARVPQGLAHSCKGRLTSAARRPAVADRPARARPPGGPEVEAARSRLLAAVVLSAPAACGSDGGSSGGTAARSRRARRRRRPPRPSPLSLTEAGCDPVTLTGAGRRGHLQRRPTPATPRPSSRSCRRRRRSSPRSSSRPGPGGTSRSNLVAGDYEVICGAPSNTRAALTVTGEGGAAAGATVDPAAARRRDGGVHDVRERAGRPARGRHRLSSSLRSRVATSPRPRRSTRRCAGRGSASSPWPSSSPTATLRSTAGSTTSAARTTRSSPASTASRRACGWTGQHQRARHVRRPAADRRRGRSPPTSGRLQITGRTSW